MSLADLSRLLALGALWGASFLFMRIAVPAFGPVWLIALRVGIAAAFLGALALLFRQDLPLRRHGGHFLILGLSNSALPFLLFAYAAQTLPASTLSVLNASSPLFGAIIAWLWLGQRPSASTVAGLVLGLAGVAAMLGTGFSASSQELLAMAAATAAPVCYALASVYTRQRGELATPFANAAGSMIGATMLLVPALPFAVPAAPPSPAALGAALGLGLLCTGVAYVLYFRLVAAVGAIPALSVTYLIPAFGILWGVLFLDERMTASTWLGLAGILAGTALVTGLVDRLRTRRAGA